MDSGDLPKPFFEKPPLHTFPERIYFRKEPEVIANPPLDTLSFMYSVPLANEWKNGQFLKNVHALLSQHLEHGQSIEANYIVNLNEKKFNKNFDTYVSYDDQHRFSLNLKALQEDNVNWEVWQENRETLRFIRNLVEVQRVALDDSQKIHIESLIQRDTDPLHREILRLAAQKASQVRISAIDTMMFLPEQLDYPGQPIWAARTIGMDYARARMKGDGIFMMYDVDTVPSSNRFSAQLMKTYDDHPEISYAFVGLAYQPASGEKNHISGSPHEQLQRTYNYNDGSYREYRGSPQISFRIKAADQLKDIAGFTSTGYAGEEDRDTAKRISGFFADMQKGCLFYTEGMDIPISLTADRADGTVDGANRIVKVGEEEIISFFGKVESQRKNLEDKINQISDESLRERIKKDLQRVRNQIESQQKVQNRFNKEVVRQFLRLYDSGSISRFYTNPATQSEVLQGPYGKATVQYLRANRVLIDSLHSADIELMRYYVGLRENFPENIDTLSPFQISMREYIGDYQSFDEVKNQLVAEGEGRYMEGRSKDNKATILQPMVTEILTLGYLDFRYFQASDFGTWKNENPYWRLDSPQLEFEYKDILPRRKWIQSQLEQSPSPALQSQLLDELFSLVQPIYKQMRSES